MKYMGSKARIAKDILPIILKDRKPNQWFVDMFCGGCNLLDKVEGKRIGNDINIYLIEMWKGLKNNNKRPLEIPKSLYNEARDNYNGKIKTMDNFTVGWIGWMASFNGRFFDGGYSGLASGRNYIDEQIRNTSKQIPLLQDVNFYNKSYDDFVFKESCIIYCDIPYKNTKQYAVSKDFNHEEFWQWCRDMSIQGHSVFISEYNAPDDFLCIWSKEVTNSMNTTKTTKPLEKLFKYML